MIHQDEVPQEITPPQTIMVNWVSAIPATKAPSPVAAPQPKSIKPKLDPVKTKPKPHAPDIKESPVVTTQAESASPMIVPTSEPLTAQAQKGSMAEPETTASSHANQTSVEGNQAPITLPNHNADYLNNPAPVYPAQSRQLSEQGKVLLRVLVNADGSVAQVTLRKTSGYERLDSTALETVKQWRFVPAKRAAQPIAAWVVVPISFSLEG